MSKISIIIKREYLARVRKRSFIIMTLIAPLLLAAMFVVPVWIMTQEDTDLKKIAVIEEGTQIFNGIIPNTQYLKFEYLQNTSLDEIKNNFTDLGYYGILFISPKITYIPNAVQLISTKQPPLETTMHITNALEKEIERLKLETYNIKDLDQILKEIDTQIKLQTIKITEDGTEKETSTGIAMGIAYISGLLIYMLTFIFGAQVMRGVIEEKTSRIVEVIISSVKPFQLMMGKIIGIALVGLTQFFCWVIITFAILSVAQSILVPDMESIPQSPVPENIMSSSPVANTQPAEIQELSEVQQIFNNLGSQNWAVIIGSFIFFFLGGYLLYASLFAAIGSAVDNETDTQQFMMPITIPLLLALFVAMGAFQNPESSVAFWFSLIPLTSPVVMMARIPFGVPGWQIGISILLLILTFLGTTWMAAKIYRTGILLYGKKPTYKEMWKWLRYKI
ncbi:MAG: ABC transporter permease [Bacteroidales bacterium]|nr:MAG: ABC transporter permease [Bacteroidales bacterium]